MFGRDARMVEDVDTFTMTKFVGKREMWDDKTNRYVDRFITYESIPQAGTFTRTINAVSIVKKAEVPGSEISRQVLLFDVEQLNFYYYRLVDPEIPNYDPVARTVLEVKHVQLEAKLKRNVLNLDNTNYIISARFMMRNQDVGE